MNILNLFEQALTFADGNFKIFPTARLTVGKNEDDSYLQEVASQSLRSAHGTSTSCYLCPGSDSKLEISEKGPLNQKYFI